MSRFTTVGASAYIDVWGGTVRTKVPSAKVVDSQTGQTVPILYTVEQAAFVARYLNDVDSGVIVLNPLR